MIIGGIDYSMSSPSLCVYDTSKDFKFENCDIYYANAKKKYVIDNKNIHGFVLPETRPDEPMYRYNEICKIFANLLLENKVEKVCIEGYALGSHAGLVFNIAENTALLKHFMWKSKIDYINPSPSTIKKFFTGKGNADKIKVVDTFINETGINLQDIFGTKTKEAAPINDICDSYAMCKYMNSFLKGEIQNG